MVKPVRRRGSSEVYNQWTNNDTSQWSRESRVNLDFQVLGIRLGELRHIKTLLSPPMWEWHKFWHHRRVIILHWFHAEVHWLRSIATYLSDTLANWTIWVDSQAFLPLILADPTVWLPVSDKANQISLLHSCSNIFMAMLIAWVLFFVPEVKLVTTLRDNHAMAYEKGTICLKKCCSSKCSNQNYQLKGDLKGDKSNSKIVRWNWTNLSRPELTPCVRRRARSPCLAGPNQSRSYAKAGMVYSSAQCRRTKRFLGLG